MRNTNTTGNVILTAVYGDARVYLDRKGLLKPIDGSELQNAARFESYEEAGKVLRRKRKAAPVYARDFWDSMRAELLYMGVRG